MLYKISYFFLFVTHGCYPVIPCLLSVCFDDAMHGRYASFYVNKGTISFSNSHRKTAQVGSNVGHVLSKEICFILCKHNVRSKLVNSLPSEADLLCQNIYHYKRQRGQGIPPCVHVSGLIHGEIPYLARSSSNLYNIGKNPLLPS